MKFIRPHIRIILFTLLFLVVVSLLLVGREVAHSKIANTQVTKNCDKYINQVNQTIGQFNNSQKEEVRDSNNSDGPPANALYIEKNELKEIFYSPKVGSCVYLLSSKTLFKSLPKTEGSKWRVAFETYHLIKLTSGDELNLDDGLPQIQMISRGDEFRTKEFADKIINSFR